MEREMAHCDEHSGCIERIGHLEKQDKEQWDKMAKIEDKFDSKFNSIFNRINVILGGVVVACIMLAINIVFKTIS
jgi:cell division protein FtsL